MSDLDNIVDISITRETASVARASFGVPAIISEFSTAKTTVAFVRHRHYASLAEMVTDGWTAYDLEYKAAQKIFSQNPKVESVMIGRIDSGDANLTASLAAIQVASTNWYAFLIIGTKTAEIQWAGDFITGNSIVLTINGVAVTAVPFNASQAQTLADLETQIEADIATSVVTASGLNGLTISIPDTTPSSIIEVMTGGATQTTETITYDDTGVETDLKTAAAWAETQIKLFLYSSSDVAIKAATTTDIAAFMETQNYDRTVSIYHTASNIEQVPAWMEAAWPGETLPYDPGVQTWAYKTLTGIAAYLLTSAEQTNIFSKNCAIYTEVGGVDITQEGRVASGEWIDVIRGLDALTAALQEGVFTQLVNKRKIPFTDGGIQLIANTTEGVLNDFATDPGLLVKSSIVVTAPKASEITAANKSSRTLPNINFVAVLQGAIHKVNIRGVVTA